MPEYNYEKVYEQYLKYIPWMEDWTAKYQNNLKAEFKKMFPKSKKFEVTKFPKEWFDTYREPWNIIASKVSDSYKRRKELLGKILLALDSSEIEIKFQPEKHLVYSCSPHKYSSQPSKYSYAKGDVEIERDFLLKVLPEIQCEIINKTSSSYGKWGIDYTGEIELWANILPWQYHYIQNHFNTTLMEWCVACWKHNINPKVRNPFISDYVYDESMRIHMSGEK